MNDLCITPGLQTEQGFGLIQREAKLFISSSMVPDTFRDYVLDKQTGEWKENPQALSNAIIALNMAFRMNADPLMVMQNLFVVHGYPSWSAKFLIALFNTCGRFTAIRYAMNEERNFCFAHCKELATGERIEGPSVSLAMAKAEGWSTRKGNKWLTMPEVMLRNRAAAFLIRTTAPELSLGLPMRDEAEDIIDVDAREAAPSSLQTVRDILKDNRLAQRLAEEGMQPKGDKPPEPPEPMSEPMSEPVAPEPVPADEPTSPTGGTPMPLHEEPAELPLKDGEKTASDAQRTTKAKREARPFDADAYAARVEKIGDVDLLVLMREEIATLPPSVREDMAALIDRRIHSLVPPEGD